MGAVDAAAFFGTSDGAPVGDREAAALSRMGAVDGILEGRSDGVLEGFAVGLGDERTVRRLGDLVGARVGAFDGRAVGSAVVSGAYDGAAEHRLQREPSRQNWHPEQP